MLGWSLHWARKRYVCSVKPSCSGNIFIVGCIFDYTGPPTIQIVIIHDHISLLSLPSFVHITIYNLIDIVVIIFIFVYSYYIHIYIYWFIIGIMITISCDHCCHYSCCLLSSIFSILLQFQVFIDHTPHITTMIPWWMAIMFVNDR